MKNVFQRTILGEIIHGVKEDSGKPLKDLTVLSASRDPYRLDTPANHKIGQWMYDTWQECHNGGRIHLRGLHYKFVGRAIKPDGTPYHNTDETWEWMSEKAAKAARFLSYIPWDALRDARNSPPQVYTPEFEPPSWSVIAGEVEVLLPEVLEPRFSLDGDLYRQPYRQVVIAEKQGVEDLLLPICQRRRATLVLPGGEISDQLIYELLRDAQEDGRPVVFHSLGDFDPAGRQMAVSIARKVQALIDTQFPNLDARVHAPALTLEQCEEWNLPSTPLKEGESRASRWIEAFGREQTELDAAVALAPRQISKVIEDHLLQYFDISLGNQAAAMREELEEQANERLAEQLGDELLETIRTEAEEKLSNLEDLTDELNDAMRVDIDVLDVDRPDTPEPIVGEVKERFDYLIDTEECDWEENTRALKRRKGY